MSAHIAPLWSADRDQIASALFQFQQACPTVPKTETAQIKKDGRVVKEYDYTDLAAAAIYIKPHLAACGLVWTQDYAGPYVATRVTHAPSGQFKEGYGPMPDPDRKGDGQAWGSLITYMRRYYLLAALGIVAEDEDDDGQKGSAKPDPRPAPAARPQPPERAPAGERREAPRQAQRAPAQAANVPEHVRTAMATRGPNTRDKQPQNVGDMSDDDMGYWIKRYNDNPGEGKWRDTNLRQLQAMLIVWRHRSGALHPLDPDSAQSQNRERQAGDDDEPYEGDGGGEDDIPY